MWNPVTSRKLRGAARRGAGRRPFRTLTGESLESRNLLAGIDLHVNGLEWSLDAGGVDWIYEVRGAALPAEPSARLALYWSPTEHFELSQATLIQEFDPEKDVGVYGPTFLSSAQLGSPPAESRFLLLVADPHAHLEEMNETNNVSSLSLPDIDARVEIGSRWEPLETGGGVTLVYQLQTEHPISPGVVRLLWASEPDLESQVGQAGPDIFLESSLGQSQTVSLHIPHSLLGSPPEEAEYLIAVADMHASIPEVDESNNLGVLPLSPLGVNVVTHGFNPNPLASQQAFLAPYRNIATNLSQLSTPRSGTHSDSILEDRVTSYVHEWSSTAGFYESLLVLFGAQVSEAIAQIEQRQTQPDAERIASAETLSELLQELVELGTFHSRALAWQAAVDALKQLTDRELLDGDNVRSQISQRIHLIGHSRGAAVNAWLSRLLVQQGYTNVVQSTTLDGFATDWPTGAGLLGDNDLASLTKAARKVNYQVDQSLNEFINDNLTLILFLFQFEFPGQFDLSGWRPSAELLQELETFDLRAPARANDGFEDLCLRAPASSADPSNHVNISSFYGDSLELNYPATQEYLFDNYFGWNRFAGSPHSPEVPLQQGEFDQSPCGATAGDNGPAAVVENRPTSAPHFGFPDGNTERLGRLWQTIESTPFDSFEDALLDGYVSILQDQSQLIDLLWDTTGAVRLHFEEDNTSLELRDSNNTSLSSFLLLPPRSEKVEFDVSVLAAGTGDRLVVMFDEVELAVLELTEIDTDIKQSVLLNTVAADAGRITFALEGGAANATTILLDNLEVISASNHAPTLDPLPGTLGEIHQFDNPGVPIRELVVGVHDEDADDRLGIALIGTLTPDEGIVQHSFDGGTTWNKVPSVREDAAFLLSADRGTRLRFVPSSTSDGPLENVLSFRGWDQTTGIATIQGELADTTENGGSTAFSSEIRRIAATVDLHTPTLAVRVWHDQSREGERTGDEPGLGSVSVELYDVGLDGRIGGGDDILHSTQESNPTGNVRFENVPAGDYFLRFAQLPENFAFTFREVDSMLFDTSEVTPESGESALFTFDIGAGPLTLYAGMLDRPWMNHTLQEDVDADGMVIPFDVLNVINLLNHRTLLRPDGRLPQLRTPFPDVPFYDVNGDGFATSNDVLRIINSLNRGDAEGELAVAWSFRPTDSVAFALFTEANTQSNGVASPRSVPQTVPATLTAFQHFQEGRSPLRRVPSTQPLDLPPLEALLGELMADQELVADLATSWASSGQ